MKNANGGKGERNFSAKFESGFHLPFSFSVSPLPSPTVPFANSRAAKRSSNLSMYTTDPFTVLEHENPWLYITEEQEICRYSDLEDLKLPKGRSGGLGMSCDRFESSKVVKRSVGSLLSFLFFILFFFVHPKSSWRV